MAVLRNSDVKKMSSKEMDEKLKELKFELIKGSTQASKGSAKTKEIKKAISRLLTYKKLNKSNKEELNKK